MGMSSVYRLMKLNRAIRSHRPKFLDSSFKCNG